MARQAQIDELREDLRRYDEHVVRQTAEAAMLRHDVAVAEENRRRDNRWRDALLTILTMFVVALLVAGLIVVPTVINNRRAIDRQERTAQLVIEGNNRVIECTTPDDPANPVPALRVHECFDDAQARTNAAVQQIIGSILGPLGVTTTTVKPKA